MGMLPPLVLELRATAGELFAEVHKVNSEVNGMAAKGEMAGGRMQAGFAKLAGAGKAAAIGVGVAGIAIAAYGIETGAAAEKTEAQLNNALKNAGSSFKKMGPEIEEQDSKLRKYGITNEDTNKALTSLTIGLHDPEKAMQAVSVAADLAKAKNIDLATASNLVMKGMEGQTKPLKALGIDLPVMAGNSLAVKKAQDALAAAQDKANAIILKTPGAANASSKAHAAYEAALAKVATAQKKVTDVSSSGGQILDALKGRVHGAAAAFGETLSGKLAQAKAGMENIGEKIGKVLIPILLQVIKVGQQWGDWLGKHKPVLIAMAAIIGGVLLVAIGAYVVSMAAAAVATIAASWPLILIIAGIGLLVAAILWLVANWDGVIKFLAGAWKNFSKMITDVVANVVNWLKDNWPLILAILTGPIGLAVLWIVKNWGAIVGFFVAVGKAISDWWTGLWNGIIGFAMLVFRTYVSFLTGIFNGILGFFISVGGAISAAWSRIWSGVGDVIRGAFNGVVSFVKGIFNTIIGVVNSIIDGINAATSVGAVIGIKVGKIPHLPSLDSGGPTPGAPGQPSLAVIHGGEYMLSQGMLSGTQPIAPSVRDAVARSGGPGTGGGSNVTNNNVTVNATTNASPAHIASAASWELRRKG